jgi:hypothetical protein
MSESAKEILRQSAFEELRHRLDELGKVIHRSEDRDTRLAFVRLVEAMQAYEDFKRM